MTWRERLGQVDRLQHALWFKVVASCLIAVLAIAGGATYAVSQMAAANTPHIDHSYVEALKPAEPPKDRTLTPEEREESESAKARYEAAQSTERTVNEILARKADATVVLVGIGTVAALAIAVVWLGVGLTCLALGLLIGLIAWPMAILGTPYETTHDGVTLINVRWAAGRDAATFVWGIGSLTMSLFILLELLKVALSGPSVVAAIAKNVVSEAIRMKVAIVLIVLLILGLTMLPRMLDDAAPLRYRVQTFLQYGTGATFWVIAILVLFLAVASVAFEQRDRIIWQTMTKPVAAWQYLLGKWLGVVGIAAVLLAVTATGVFLFTGYLRNQLAGEEIAPYVARGKAISEDRLVLETQVLAARISVRPQIPTLTAEDEEREVASRMKRAQASDPLYPDTPENRGRLLAELREEFRTRYLSLGPGEQRVFEFTGLEEVKKLNRPMTLRYKVSVGADDPRATARVSFQMPNASPRVQEVPLGQPLTIPISPASIEMVKPEPGPTGVVPVGAKEEAVLPILVTNGDLYRRMTSAQGDESWRNPDTMTIPPDGLEVSFPVGGYESNFLRVMIVLWLKLAFLAMVGVWAATYLSFAVACLIAFGTFLIAESAGFLTTSLEYFDPKSLFSWAVFYISKPIAWTFKNYSDLKPTENLVDGRMLDWTTVGLAIVVLGACTALLYAIAVLIFRKRELATYSGQ